MNDYLIIAGSQLLLIFFVGQIGPINIKKDYGTLKEKFEKITGCMHTAQKTAPGRHKSTQTHWFGVKIPGLDLYFMFLSLNILRVKLILAARALITFTPEAWVRFFSKPCWNWKNFPRAELNVPEDCFKMSAVCVRTGRPGRVPRWVGVWKCRLSILLPCTVGTVGAPLQPLVNELRKVFLWMGAPSLNEYQRTAIWLALKDKATPTSHWVRAKKSWDWRACPDPALHSQIRWNKGAGEPRQRARRCTNGRPPPGPQRPDRPGGAGLLRVPRGPPAAAGRGTGTRRGGGGCPGAAGARPGWEPAGSVPQVSAAAARSPPLPGCWRAGEPRRPRCPPARRRPGCPAAAADLGRWRPPPPGAAPGAGPPPPPPAPSPGSRREPVAPRPGGGMKGYLDQQVPFTFPQVRGGSAGRRGRGGEALGRGPLRSGTPRWSCSFRSSRRARRLPVAELWWALGRDPGSRPCRRRRIRKVSGAGGWRDGWGRWRLLDKEQVLPLRLRPHLRVPPGTSVAGASRCPCPALCWGDLSLLMQTSSRTWASSRRLGWQKVGSLPLLCLVLFLFQLLVFWCLYCSLALFA